MVVKDHRCEFEVVEAVVVQDEPPSLPALVAASYGGKAQGLYGGRAVMMVLVAGMVNAWVTSE